MHSFLAHVDLLGVTYQSPSIATGFGMHLAQPLLRKALEDLGPDGESKLEEADARKILENAMRVLFYRDARSLNKVPNRDRLPGALARVRASESLMTPALTHSSKSRWSRPRGSRLASRNRRRPSGALPRACEDVRLLPLSAHLNAR